MQRNLKLNEKVRHLYLGRHQLSRFGHAKRTVEMRSSLCELENCRTDFHSVWCWVVPMKLGCTRVLVVDTYTWHVTWVTALISRLERWTSIGRHVLLKHVIKTWYSRVHELWLLGMLIIHIPKQYSLWTQFYHVLTESFTIFYNRVLAGINLQESWKILLTCFM